MLPSFTVHSLYIVIRADNGGIRPMGVFSTWEEADNLASINRSVMRIAYVELTPRSVIS